MKQIIASVVLNWENNMKQIIASVFWENNMKEIIASVFSDICTIGNIILGK